MTEQSFGAFAPRSSCAPPLRLSPEAAAMARREAWDAYERIPHANLSVGRAQYRAAIAAIDELERECSK